MLFQLVLFQLILSSLGYTSKVFKNKVCTINKYMSNNKSCLTGGSSLLRKYE